MNRRTWLEFVKSLASIPNIADTSCACSWNYGNSSTQKCSFHKIIFISVVWILQATGTSRSLSWLNEYFCVLCYAVAIYNKEVVWGSKKIKYNFIKVH